MHKWLNVYCECLAKRCTHGSTRSEASKVAMYKLCFLRCLHVPCLLNMLEWDTRHTKHTDNEQIVTLILLHLPSMLDVLTTRNPSTFIHIIIIIQFTMASGAHLTSTACLWSCTNIVYSEFLTSQLNVSDSHILILRALATYSYCTLLLHTHL